MDIHETLVSLGLEQYVESFRENAIDEETFLSLTDGDLKQLGVNALGHRKKILGAIEEMSGGSPEAEPEAPDADEEASDDEDKIGCPSCGYKNERFFRFCLRCGFQLRGGPTGKSGSKPVDSGKGPWGTLVLVKPDGSDGTAFPLIGDKVRLGRGDVDLTFPEDPYMAEHELTIQIGDSGVVLTPERGTRNGIYVQLEGTVEINDGDLFRIGQQLLQFRRLEISKNKRVDKSGTVILGSITPPKLWGRLGQVSDDEQYASVYLLSSRNVYLGRETQGISFPWDGYVSRNHARLVWDGQRCVLEDLDSSNGTFVRIKASVSLTDGDRFLAGQHLFKFST